MELQGRVAIVTGAASAVGKASAHRLAHEGMRVFVVDVDRDAARDLALELDGHPFTCDVADAQRVEQAFVSRVETFGSVDLAHLNAEVGVRWAGDIGSLRISDYNHSIGVNLDGVVYGARAAVRAMRRCADGTERAIVATSSTAGLLPFHPDPLYTAGKFGVVGLVRAIAPSVALEGIAVHAICPGRVDTGALDAPTQELIDWFDVPLLKPEEVAEALVVAARSGLEAAGSCWICQPGVAPAPAHVGVVPIEVDLLNVPVPRAPSRT